MKREFKKFLQNQKGITTKTLPYFMRRVEEFCDKFSLKPGNQAKPEEIKQFLEDFSRKHES